MKIFHNYIKHALNIKYKIIRSKINDNMSEYKIKSNIRILNKFYIKVALLYI